MTRVKTGSRYNLGEPTAGKLRDFCMANYDTPEKNVLIEALNEHIDKRLASEPEMKKRYDAARKKRLTEETRGKLSVVEGDRD